MKKLLIFLFAFILILTGCGKNETNTPKGEVQKLFSDCYVIPSVAEETK